MLVRSLDDPRLFCSFGTWDDPAQVAEMRAHPYTTARIGGPPASRVKNLAGHST